MSFSSPSHVSATTGFDHQYPVASASPCLIRQAIVASCTVPTLCVFVIMTGPSRKPDSSTQVVPVISPAPFNANQPGEDGVVVRRLAARHDRGDARAHGTLADLELARAADDRAVPDRHPAHVGDRVARARRPVEGNAQVAGARLVGGASGRGREETHGEECRGASFHARESTAGSGSAPPGFVGEFHRPIRAPFLAVGPVW